MYTKDNRVRIRLKKNLLGALSVIGLGLLYYLFVRLSGIGIPCIFNTVTGLYCPGCGVSRMCMAMLRLDFAAAFKYNPALFVSLPFICYVFLENRIRYIRTGKDEMKKHQRLMLIVIIAILLLYCIYRNLSNFNIIQ